MQQSDFYVCLTPSLALAHTGYTYDYYYYSLENPYIYAVNHYLHEAFPSAPPCLLPPEYLIQGSVCVVPAVLDSQRSAQLCIPNAEVKGVCYHTLAFVFSLIKTPINKDLE